MHKSPLFAVLFLPAVLLMAQPALADNHGNSAGEELIEQIIGDIIDRTAEAARKEARRQAGLEDDSGSSRYRRDNDGDYRAYKKDRYAAHDKGNGKSRGYAYGHLPKARQQQLQQLDEDHQRRIFALEEALQRRLDKNRDDFRHQAGREGKEERIRAMKGALRDQTDRAYNDYERQLNEENRRYISRRDELTGGKK